MTKFNFSAITFLLLCIGLKGFSENPQDKNVWSTPISFELTPVALVNLPNDKSLTWESEYHDDFYVRQNITLSFTNIEAYYAPPCEPIGTPCDDGNPNTINDVEDGDCNCTGIAISCEDVEISYEINNGLRQIGAAAIVVGEGDSVELFANLENYIVRDENGDVVSNNTINNITVSQEGLYSVSGIAKLPQPSSAPVIESVSSEQSGNGVLNALDNNPATFWHSQYSGTIATHPHEIVLDMGANSVLSGFRYLPRQDGNLNGRIAGYQIFVSNSTSSWGGPVASSTFANSAALKTVNFTAKQGRYLRFVMTSAVNGLEFASAAEISVLRTTLVAVSSQEITNEDGRATNALDSNPNTIWHSRWSGAAPIPTSPHQIDIDMGADSYVSGLEYLPRQDAVLNGTITAYEIYVSNSPSAFGTAVTSGTWIRDNNLKSVSFPEIQGRYLRLKATATGGDIWASAAEIRPIRNVNVDCTKSIEINVDTIETYTYNDGTWFPVDPVGVVTANDRIIIESGDAVLDNSITCNSLVVNPGASLTVGLGAVLTANTTSLKSVSTMFSSLIVDGSIIGVVNYERYVNLVGTSVGGGNDLISSPVVNATFNNTFVTANPNLVRHPTVVGLYAFAPYSVINGKYENYNIGADLSGEFALVSGTGYRAATQIGSTLTFTGTVANSNVDIAISDAVAGKAWNLIGNPYPSYIDAESFFTPNNVDQLNTEYVALYGYTGSKNSWNIYNNATSGELIAPGQGFFVKAQSGGGAIQFTPAMRRTGSSDDFILGRQQIVNKALSKLRLSNLAENVATSIYFIEGTTRGLDPGYDAAAYAATSVDFAIFTKLLEDNAGLDIAIQSLPYEDFNDIVVPLGIKAKAGVELSISIDELSTLPFNINVYLEDTENNTLTLLNFKEYKFTSNTDLNGSGRFNVHYSAKTLSVADMQSNDNLFIYTTASPKTLYIKGQLTKASIANLYDIQGRLVLSKALNPNNTENTIDISTINTGVYVVKVNNDNQVKTQKVIIK